ncbi:MAG: AraC family transcriptional regulator [Flavobacteriales bacterium]|nr:AraC family transcriptional regulator [Flavobacteriales bacterium]
MPATVLSSDSSLWVSMQILRGIVLAAAHSPAERAAICATAGLTADDLDRVDMRLTLEQNCALMEAALRISGDAQLGLHVGERTSATVLGMTGHLMESSADLIGALQGLSAFTMAFTRIYGFRLEVVADEAALHCEPLAIWNDVSPETARHSVDYTYAGALRVLQLLSGRRVLPLRVHYRYPRPADLREHERLLGCRPLFGEDANRMVFRLADLQAPVVGYNPRMNAMLRAMLEEEIRVLAEGAPFREKVKRIVLENLQVTFPPLEAIADALCITPRTLQRKLQDEGTSFRELCDALKEEVARNLLGNPELSISDIAMRLGYAEVTSFQRAFRQWTGVPPNEYRRTLG